MNLRKDHYRWEVLLCVISAFTATRVRGDSSQRLRKRKTTDITRTQNSFFSPVPRAGAGREERRERKSAYPRLAYAVPSLGVRDRTRQGENARERTSGYERG